MLIVYCEFNKMRTLSPPLHKARKAGSTTASLPLVRSPRQEAVTEPAARAQMSEPDGTAIGSRARRLCERARRRNRESEPDGTAASNRARRLCERARRRNRESEPGGAAANERSRQRGRKRSILAPQSSGPGAA